MPTAIEKLISNPLSSPEIVYESEAFFSISVFFHLKFWNHMTARKRAGKFQLPFTTSTYFTNT